MKALSHARRCPGACAGELYPTEVRTTAHGFSAGTAKLGALWATIFFNYIGPQARFWCAQPPPADAAQGFILSLDSIRGILASVHWLSLSEVRAERWQICHVTR